MLMVRNADAYAPHSLGKCDILIAAERMVAIGRRLEAPVGIECRVIDAEGRMLVPGLIDGHVHVTGGGGEGGFHTRTPEMSLEQATLNAVTTVVGVLGTDGVARSLEALLAKIYALREEGLSAWCLSGSYRIPLLTVTGDLTKDIMMIEAIIGAGEVALSDHRSSRPTDAEFSRIAAEARMGGMLSGKAGIVNVHLGDAPAGFAMLERTVADGDMPMKQFLPTHCNRNARLFEESANWLRAGGNADYTAGPVPGMSAASAFARLRSDGVPVTNVSITSDGQGSLPRFNAGGELVGLEVGSCSSLLGALREACLEHAVPVAEVLLPFTSNPARMLKLPRKGRIEAGADADFSIMDPGFEPAWVVSRGAIMVEEGKAVRMGTFSI